MIRILFKSFALVGLTALICASGLLTSCTKTITSYDTVVTIRHDTTITYRPTGPANIRFASLVPGGSLLIWRDSGRTTLFTSALSTVSEGYIPIAPDSASVLYVEYNHAVSPLNIPSLSSGSYSTIGLYLVGDPLTGNLQTCRSNDSLKTTQIPPGYCYLRIMDGISDWPQPSPYIYLDADVLGQSVLNLAGVAQTVYFGNISNYALIKAGAHQIFIRHPDTGGELYNQSTFFNEGEFYTALLSGSHVKSTDKLTIYQE